MQVFLEQNYWNRTCSQRLRLVANRQCALKALGPMPSAKYYQEQAELLLMWAAATRDRDHAARLEGFARLLLEEAQVPEDPTFRDLTPFVDEFNDQQMRKTETPEPARQQQQQAQKKKED
jgi:hypothetical protein